MRVALILGCWRRRRVLGTSIVRWRRLRRIGFRVRARDAAGNRGGYADAVTVTTPAGPDVEPPSVPGVVVAVASAADRVELSWGAASDNVGVTGYEVERCLGAGCTDFGLLATTSSVGYVDSSVAAAATYRLPGACAGCGRQSSVVMRMR